MVIVPRVVGFEFFWPEIMINLVIKLTHKYTFYMVIGTMSLMDKQNRPKPIHPLRVGARVADMSWFLPMQTHRVGFQADRQSNR